MMRSNSAGLDRFAGNRGVDGGRDKLVAGGFQDRLHPGLPNHRAKAPDLGGITR